jgi:PhnB protein
MDPTRERGGPDMPARHVPPGWPTLVPRIAVDDPERLVAFIREVFRASGDFHRERPSELRFGDSLLMVGPTVERETANAFLYVYVEDADATYRRRPPSHDSRLLGQHLADRHTRW